MFGCCPSSAVWIADLIIVGKYTPSRTLSCSSITLTLCLVKTFHETTDLLQANVPTSTQSGGHRNRRSIIYLMTYLIDIQFLLSLHDSTLVARSNFSLVHRSCCGCVSFKSDYCSKRVSRYDSSREYRGRLEHHRWQPPGLLERAELARLCITLYNLLKI